MRRSYLLLLVFLVSLGMASPVFASGFLPGAKSQGVAAIGRPAPDFTLPKLDGTKVSLSQYRGQVVLVNFWATWCPYCRQEMPSMARLNEVFGSSKFVLLAINVEQNGAQTVPSFLKTHPYTFPILLDSQGKVQHSYGVYSFPETFIVGKNGVIVNKVVGAVDWSDPRMLSYIKHLLGAQ